ncbi:enoyl-CoA hydratase [Mycolicibacterium moriokaense]|jgi:2-(1,2-epoxy-1,2-dihydrophenyl)acetyl-CoA isomerase|uniref:2-(1,2-epoxy-1,2-dihydrophenyl)acetyl-CoA isomerase n=1 Tax=Mycolicibacterium moriokaense TaxID=39691 RepID=A0AAD1HBN0_9MYCO|nr:enoyl-CoA hydratase-related protein [Mycolicibacterium moriokaense]MCV7043010.1 enoyl-CoA hydratase/isomerase family protein [Mycolicibacterium moriokaense]ORB17981.1 enoyl-CoA hydratase [Mycolicibacterium moriokaense]BBX00983.1 2-(1,2-epoxy-1,2-dihydrophenyl)acetyl-CoA isomerase [Mycolicibacterium moriokaense]
MSASGLTTRTEGAVRWLVLDRPDVGNSVTRAMQRDIIDNLARASTDPDIRAVVFTAAGDKHFCTGPNLRDPDMQPSQDRIAGDAARILRNGSQAVVSAILDCEKPVICGLNGTAAGVGASMVLACDLIVAAESARLIELFVRRGLAPDGGAAYLLARKVPFNLAKELLMFGEEIDAQEGHRIGLINKVVAGDQLTAELAAWANRLAEGATRGIAAAKAMLNQALDMDRAAAFTTEALLVEQVAGTDDVAEGIAAFMEKRDPKFRGR